ncbi:vitamin K epoxide reductase complex subunit 1 isoform X1 [Fopius arisanus]|uniref:vitamin-K-epoxide reductase (warfarin-sensitive) n=2 Tax=Fopius arisanus TaxID=64838 RepID=A0A9R1T067_9HYME|nr:PREDICTED: vitamin K epoxide reductase complex subunit 1 isoform X1 [Fopius arisanus]
MSTTRRFRGNCLMSGISSKLHKLNTGLVTSCVVGLALSYYSYIVETAKEQDENYEAMCDISEHVSCTKAFMSEYGKGFGLIPESSIFYLPNCLYGLGFYAIIAIISVFNKFSYTVVLLSLSIGSCLSSVYLAWVLYILNSVCVVCVSTYVVNAVILVLSYRKLRILTRPVPSAYSQKSNRRKRH